MLVRHLPTGQIGEIPDDKFDPNLFEVYQEGQAPAPTTNTPTQAPGVQYNKESLVEGGLPGGIWDILKSVISPARLATSAAVQAPIAAISGGKVNTYDIPIIGGLLGMSNKELEDKFGKVNDTVETRVKKGLTTGVKEAVKAASMVAAPGMKVGLGGLTLPKAGFMYGAGQGAVQGVAADEVTPESVLMSTLFGGVLGKAGAMLPKASQDAAEGALDSRNAAYMTRSAQDGAFIGASKDDQVNVAKEYLKDFLGNPKKMQRELPKVTVDISNKVKNRLDPNHVIDGFEDKVRSGIKENLLKTGRERMSTYGTDFDDVFKLIMDKVGKKANETNIYAAKEEFTDIVKPIFKNINNNTAPSKLDQVRLAAHKALNDIIDTFPDVQARKLNRDQNILNDLANSLEGSINKERIFAPLGFPLFNMRGAEQATLNKIAEGKDMISAVTKPFSNLSSDTMSKAGGIVGGQIGKQSTQAPTGEVPQEYIEKSSGEIEFLGSLLEKKQQDEVSRGVGEEKRITTDMYSQMMLDPRLNTKTKDYVTKVYKAQVAQGKAEADPVSVKQKKQASSKALGDLKSLKDQYEKKKLARGPAKGLYDKAMSVTQRDADVKSYMDIREAVTATFSKALGNVGTLSDGDIERALKMIPDITDTPEVAAQKWQYIENLLVYKE